jgi:Flp pilus assembly protein TadG
MGFCNVPNPELNNARGQSTIEFAFIAPLVLGCAVFLITTTVVCLQVIQLHDLVRTTTRIAVTTNDPETYVLNVGAQHNVNFIVNDDHATGMVTVQATRKTRVPLWGSVTALLGLRATATMMRESPPVLSR